MTRPGDRLANYRYATPDLRQSFVLEQLDDHTGFTSDAEVAQFFDYLVELGLLRRV